MLEWKILDETLAYGGVAYGFESWFPVMDNYHKKILQFIEVELLSKWKLYESSISAFPNKELPIVESEFRTYLLRVLVLMISGYVLAFSVFVGEIVWYYCISKRFQQIIDLRNQKKQRFQLLSLRNKKIRSKSLPIYCMSLELFAVSNSQKIPRRYSI